jgi:hypothetical protein
MWVWRIWQALQKPYRKDVLSRRLPPVQGRRNVQGCLNEISELIGVIFWPLGAIVLATPLGATYLGLKLCSLISRQIRYAQRGGMEDTLALIPRGQVGVAWAAARAVYDDEGTWLRFYRFMYWVVVLPLLLLCAASSLTVTLEGRDNALLLPLIGIGVFMLFTTLDNIFSVVTAVLCGMAGPQLHRSYAAWIGSALFGAVQVVAYALMLLLLFLPSVLPLSDGRNLMLILTVYAVIFVVYWLVRIQSVQLLARYVLTHLNANADELSDLLDFGADFVLGPGSEIGSEIGPEIGPRTPAAEAAPTQEHG